ncbi:MAG: ATP-binding protein [Clostridiales bacterium]|nr:ATP-binding protein [Clostridiales bacterium]
MIARKIEDSIRSRLDDRKAIIIIGARQVGKTTLLESIFKDEPSALWLSGDEPDVRAIFEDVTSTRLKALFGDVKYVIIDEAQRINNIGVSLKLITDQIKSVKVVATGSSSFELAGEISESLAGRKWEYLLHPLSFSELVSANGLLDEKRLLPHRLVFGSYPEVAMSAGIEKALLKELAGSILYKDILRLEDIKSPDKLDRLLRALACQIGSQVSYNELAQTCGLSQKTVEKYIDILEKAFIVFRLGTFSRNLRNELKKSRKVFFWDNGIRNVLISDFRPAEMRQDIGSLWENYLIAERLKLLSYRESMPGTWFWRTAQQQEIDYVEEQDGSIHAYEMKWSPKAKAASANAFLSAYPGSTVETVTPDNYDEFLGS